LMIPHIIFIGALISMASTRLTIRPEVIPESRMPKVFYTVRMRAKCYLLGNEYLN
jgi:hypothetical protein